MVKLNSEQFWQFCLEHYPGLQQPLLRLQDDVGANVNVLLLLLYAEQHRWHWSAAEITRLHQAVQPVNQQVTLPIRLLRRQLSEQPTIKSSLLQAELAAEQLEQQALLAALPEPTAGKAADLLCDYLTQLAPSTKCWQQILFDLRQSQIR